LFMAFISFVKPARFSRLVSLSPLNNITLFGINLVLMACSMFFVSLECGSPTITISYAGPIKKSSAVKNMVFWDGMPSSCDEKAFANAATFSS